MKALVLAAVMAFGFGGAAMACKDASAGKPCMCKEHKGMGEHHGKGHHGKKGGCCDDMGSAHARPEHAKPMGDDMDCCGKGKKHHHHGDRKGGSMRPSGHH